MTPNDYLRAAGEALYGPRWHTDLARDLAVSDRTVRRWASGSETPRPGVLQDVWAIVKRRQGELGAILAQLPDEARIRINPGP